MINFRVCFKLIVISDVSGSNDKLSITKIVDKLLRILALSLKQLFWQVDFECLL